MSDCVLATEMDSEAPHSIPLSECQLEMDIVLTQWKQHLKAWFASIMLPNVVHQSERRDQREVNPEFSIQARMVVSSGATASGNEQ